MFAALLRSWAFTLITAVVTTTRIVAVELEPIGRGPFEIACTNLEVQPREGVPMFDFLNGKRTAEGTLYLTDILKQPAAVPQFEVKVPPSPHLFAVQAGTTLPVLLVVFYPTPADNPRADYSFPYKDTGDRVLPHMQRGSEQPLLAGAGKFPLIIESGGYNTHPLWHLEHLKMLASHGYIVADVIHGDGRGASFESNLALRALEVRLALDYLLQQSAFAPAIDPERIGAAGQSAGGHTLLTLMGGQDPKGRIPATADPRIKAGFGLVPFTGRWMGMPPFRVDGWYFGQDFAGLRAMRVPFFAVYGEKDESVPAPSVEAAVGAMPGPATAVKLDGETHSLSNAANNDIYTWELLFFDAWLRGDPVAREKLATGTSVRGGVHDHRTITR